ncbi:hypothetical protein PVAG01_08546 [Phlyctema vagabunda]|uniref:Uncharacterized protein n=1 Tax=Phlyctema vagabunda TaxID=108571 RepID=A0ABR4P9Q4_9HELO
MESSPLTLAHDHARAASIATHGLDTTVAINEHALAAGEFAKAATSTGSAEALRILKLLEVHHQRLAELSRYPVEHPVTANSTEPEVQAAIEKPLSTSAAVAELRASKHDVVPRSSSPLRTPSNIISPRRLPSRDNMSSSIASNLASARGIRSNYNRQPLSPSVSSLQAPGNLDMPRKESKRSKVPSTILEDSISKPSWVPPTPSNQNKATAQTGTSRTSVVAEQASHSTAPADEGFSKFYNAFESILSKLSGPLAFAGLPLVTENETAAPSAPESSSGRRTKSTSKERLDSEPDLSKYISRAALRASNRDGHSGNDSFYVVPTTGHTVSYAHILSFAEKEKRRMAASIYSDSHEPLSEPSFEDEFVDARETPMPPSPGIPKKMSNNRKKGDKEMENRVEELYMENMTLKECVDKLSKRLHVFEMSAQQNSLALQDSMRIMRPNSPARETSRVPPSDDILKRRVQDLEDQMNFQGKENDRLGKENEKLKMVVNRYREKWEKLKEGAKARRDGTMAKDGLAKDSQSVKDSSSKPGPGNLGID